MRGLSQLDLASTAETTTRHVSFLETGRSRPSRAMVARLTEAMGLPLRERNALFHAAGLAAPYAETPLVSADLAPFRQVVARLLANHDPYPAYVIDRHWNIVDANAAAQRFLPPDAERNAIRLTYGGGWRPLITNWSEIAWPGVRRLQKELARSPDDTALAALVDQALAEVRDLPEPGPETGERVLCPHFRIGDQVIRTMTVVAQFGAAQDVTLDELRIELICPADEVAEAYFQAAALGDRAEA